MGELAEQSTLLDNKSLQNHQQKLAAVLSHKRKKKLFKSQLRQQNSIPGFDELLERYYRCPVLLVDDIGMGGSGSEWEYGILEEIVNHRYRYQLTTAIVTNKDLDELPDRIVSRFRDPEVGVIVLNEGRDYRKG